MTLATILDLAVSLAWLWAGASALFAVLAGWVGVRSALDARRAEREADAQEALVQSARLQLAALAARERTCTPEMLRRIQRGSHD